MSLEDMKKKESQLRQKGIALEFAVDIVNDKTREIKYDNTPMEIYLHVEQLAEKHGIDVTYEVNAIREKVNELESAIYELVTPFEDEVRHITWQADDLEYEIEEVENGND